MTHSTSLSFLLAMPLGFGLLPLGAAQEEAAQEDVAQDETPAPESVAPESVPSESADATTVYARVLLLGAEIELVRFEMGKPRSIQQGFRVRNAATHEVFFQSLTLFDKANRLCFEITRERMVAPSTPAVPFEPGHALEVVNAALVCVRKVKAQLHIEALPERPSLEAGKTAKDVFHAIVRNNRQLNLLLEREFGPSEVYEKVTLAVSYAARILQLFPGEAKIPDPPPFDRGKRPVDVYRRLLTCFEQVRSIANLLALETLELDASETDWEAVTPSDVYDVASLLVSELAYLHSKYPEAKPPRQALYPGRKFPSHVYQRAGMLEKQLIDLLAQLGAQRGADAQRRQ